MKAAKQSLFVLLTSYFFLWDPKILPGTKYALTDIPCKQCTFLPDLKDAKSPWLSYISEGAWAHKSLPMITVAHWLPGLYSDWQGQVTRSYCGTFTAAVCGFTWTIYLYIFFKLRASNKKYFAYLAILQCFRVKGTSTRQQNFCTEHHCWSVKPPDSGPSYYWTVAFCRCHILLSWLWLDSCCRLLTKYLSQGTEWCDVHTCKLPNLQPAGTLNISSAFLW